MRLNWVIDIIIAIKETEYMFDQISDFGYKRSAFQAIGFYIAYLIVTIIIAAVTGMVYSMAIGSTDFGLGQKVGMIVAILFTLMFAFLILQSKRLLNNYTYLGLAAFAGVLAYLGGGLLGMIIPAYLTTLGTSTKKKAKK